MLSIYRVHKDSLSTLRECPRLVGSDHTGQSAVLSAAAQADHKVSGEEWSACALKGLAVKAVEGDAVMFFSLHPDGSEDPTSLHGSCPTTRGDKWSATKWIHVASTSCAPLS